MPKMWGRRDKFLNNINPFLLRGGEGLKLHYNNTKERRKNKNEKTKTKSSLTAYCLQCGK